MPNTQTPLNALCFLLRTETTGSRDITYGHTSLHVRGWDTTIRDFKSTWPFETPWHNFKVSCQYDDSGTTKHETYGTAYGFLPSNSDMIILRDAERAYKTLSALERKLTKLQDSFGHYTSFGELCIRLAMATGIKRFCWHDNGKIQLSTDQVHMRYRIDSDIRSWHINNPRDTACSA